MSKFQRYLIGAFLVTGGLIVPAAGFSAPRSSGDGDPMAYAMYSYSFAKEFSRVCNTIERKADPVCQYAKVFSETDDHQHIRSANAGKSSAGSLLGTDPQALALPSPGNPNPAEHVAVVYVTSDFTSLAQQLERKEAWSPADREGGRRISRAIAHATLALAGFEKDGEHQKSDEIVSYLENADGPEFLPGVLVHFVIPPGQIYMCRIDCGAGKLVTQHFEGNLKQRIEGCYDDDVDFTFEKGAAGLLDSHHTVRISITSRRGGSWQFDYQSRPDTYAQTVQWPMGDPEIECRFQDPNHQRWTRPTSPSADQPRVEAGETAPKAPALGQVSTVAAAPAPGGQRDLR